MCKQTEGIFWSPKGSLTYDFLVDLEFDAEFLDHEEQREEEILTQKYFVGREEEREIGLRLILSKRVKGKKEFDLEWFVQVEGRKEE